MFRWPIVEFRVIDTAYMIIIMHYFPRMGTFQQLAATTSNMDQHSGMNGSGVTILTKTSTSPIPESSNFTYAQEGSAFVGFDVIRKMLSWYQFFKNYLDHFGLLLTTIVVFLACSLRAEPYIHIAQYC